MGHRDFLSVLLSLSVSQQFWEELNFKGQQLSPHTSSKKANLGLAFFFPNAAARFSPCSVPTLGLSLTSQSAAFAPSSPSKSQMPRPHLA